MSKINTKTALIFVLVTVCIDSIGLGIIIPSFPVLVSETAHVSFEDSKDYFGWAMGAYAFMTFLFSPMVGNLSDRYGRRPVLLISVLGMGLDYLVMYFAPTLFWLVIGRAVSGIFGASFTSAAAYIADISDDESRARNFGMIGAAFGIGFIIGPAIGGLLSDFGTRAPFLVASLFSLANFIFGLIVLKESLPADNRRAFDIKRANPLGAFKQMKRFMKLKYLFVVTFLYMLANMAVHSTWNYFTMEKFGWDIKQVGISLTVVGVCFGIVQGIGSGFIIKRLGEKGGATLGILSIIIINIVMGIVPYGWMIYVLLLPYALSGIIDPAIRSIFASRTKDNEQGELQGVFTSIMSVAEIVGPPFFMLIYSFARLTFSESPYSYGAPMFFAALLGIGALTVLRFTLKDRPESDTIIDDTKDS